MQGRQAYNKGMDSEADIIRQAMSIMGKRGGPARAASLTPARRTEIAHEAALARWSKADKHNDSSPTKTPQGTPYTK